MEIYSTFKDLEGNPINHISMEGAASSSNCGAESSRQEGISFTLDVTQREIRVGSAQAPGAFMSSTVVTDSLTGPRSD